MLKRGKIRVYRIDIPSYSDKPPEKRTLLDKKKNKHTFVPSSSLLITNPKEVLTFNHKKEANEYLEQLSPDRVTLQNLVEELELPRTVTDDEYNELLDLIATGLAAGTLISIIDRVTTPPAGTSDDTAGMHTDIDASEGPETPHCTFDLMTLHCKSYPETRSYKLDVIKSKPNLNGYDKALQVIAKNGYPNTITVNHAGSCANGSKECPSIKISSDSFSGIFTDNPYKLKALPLEKEREPGDFSDFLKYYLVPDLSGLDYQVYTVEKAGCNGNEGHIAKVHAFPGFKWDGKVALNYEQHDGKTPDVSDTGKDRYKNRGKSVWNFSAGITGKVGTKNWAFESADKNSTQRFFPTIQDSIADFVEKLDDMYRKAETSRGLIQFKMDWPSISLGGNIELLEASDNFDVDIGGEIALSMDPLFKAEIRTDILEWLLLNPVVGPFLQEVKTRAARGLGSENLNVKAIIAIDLIITGEAAASLKWKKAAHDKWLSTEGAKEGETGGGVTIGMEAKIHAEAKIFYVKMTIGAAIHIKGNTEKTTTEGIGIFPSLYATTEKGKPAIGGKVRFTGAAIYYAYYAEVGSEEIANEQKKTSSKGRNRGRLDHKKNTTAKNYREERMKKLLTIFEENNWPRDSIVDIATPLTNIEN